MTKIGTATPTATRTRTATATPSATPIVVGPDVTYFGILNRIDGCVFCCEQSCATTPTPTPKLDAQGRRIFDTKSGQFLIVVEGKRGASGLAPSDSLMPTAPDNRPDLQIQSTTDLGNGSLTVCDTGSPPAGGGIPGVEPPSFADGDSLITNAMADFACRFQVFNRSFPCTKLDATGEAQLVNSASIIQFCDAVATTTAFPPGETILSVRLRDAQGNVGPIKQIVVRVATPTPSPRP